MADETIRRAPYTFTIYLTDWGYRVSGKSDTQGDLGLLDAGEHVPKLSPEADGALWDLIDEKTFQRKTDAKKAIREWLSMAPKSSSSAGGSE